MGKSTISMSIFNSYVSLSEGKSQYPLVIKHGNGTSRIGFHKKTSIAIGCSVPTMITKGQPPVNFLNICKLSNYHTHHLSVNHFPSFTHGFVHMFVSMFSHYIPLYSFFSNIPIVNGWNPIISHYIPLFPILSTFSLNIPWTWSIPQLQIATLPTTFAAQHFRSEGLGRLSCRPFILCRPGSSFLGEDQWIKHGVLAMKTCGFNRERCI